MKILDSSVLRRSETMLVETTQLLTCVWLCYLVDYSLPGSSVHGVFPARIPEQVAISSSRGWWKSLALLIYKKLSPLPPLHSLSISVCACNLSGWLWPELIVPWFWETLKETLHLDRSINQRADFHIFHSWLRSLLLFLPSSSWLYLVEV